MHLFPEHFYCLLLPSFLKTNQILRRTVTNRLSQEIISPGPSTVLNSLILQGIEYSVSAEKNPRLLQTRELCTEATSDKQMFKETHKKATLPPHTTFLGAQVRPMQTY